MSRVQLYVYDLSRGMARSMSMMLTGKQIDGIWHTSVVAYNREIFFGQGILEARPGTTHHGAPAQIIECGTTEIDEATYTEYIASLGEMYTPQAYHLIEFNCNHFTADVVGFLTGREIPGWISGLPAEFLSTPFGQAMRPQIDAMFRRTAPTEHPVSGTAGPSNAPAVLPTPPALGISTPSPASVNASSLLSSIAAQAAGPTPASTPPIKPSPETSPLILASSKTHFDSVLRSHSAVIVNFTNTPTCPPCRAIKPAYESLAADMSTSYASKGIQFVEVELGIGEGREIAGRHGVSATPTFQFFKDGKKVDEMKGATKPALEAKVAAFLEDCFPKHPHRKVYLPAIEAIPLSPIMSNTVPNYPALLAKLEGFAAGRPGAAQADLKVLKDEAVPLLQGKVLSDADLTALVDRWTKATVGLLKSLQPEQTFPAIDLWRVALLQPRVCAVLALSLSPAASTSSSDLLTPILDLASSTLAAGASSTPKPFLLTVLRLLTNLLAVLPLANLILSTPSPSEELGILQGHTMSILVESLLHSDGGVRSAAAGVAVNLAGWRHRAAKEAERAAEDMPEADWEVEGVSALLEGLGREEDEDVAHRLLVALALLLWLAPGYELSLRPLLEVLNAKETIKARMKGWKKKEVRKLAEEVVKRLC